MPIRLTISRCKRLGLPIFFESKAEVEATAAIEQLWASIKEKEASIRRTKQELLSHRYQLGGRLSWMKGMHVGCGRGNRWASYLRARNIPRKTADNYVRKYR